MSGSETFATAVENRGYDYDASQGRPAPAKNSTWPTDHRAVVTTYRWPPCASALRGAM